MKFKKGQNYGYNEIREFSNTSNYCISEFGNSLVGQEFILLVNYEKDYTISFVMTGWSGQAIYECIYSYTG